MLTLGGVSDGLVGMASTVSYQLNHRKELTWWGPIV